MRGVDTRLTRLFQPDSVASLSVILLGRKNWQRVTECERMPLASSFQFRLSCSHCFCRTSTSTLCPRDLQDLVLNLPQKKISFCPVAKSIMSDPSSPMIKGRRNNINGINHVSMSYALTQILRTEGALISIDNVLKPASFPALLNESTM